MGALYRVPEAPGLALGLAVQNIGPTVKFQQASENLPLNIRMGGAYAFTVGRQKSALALDVTKERSEGALIGFGAETIVAKALALRLGYNTRNAAGPGVSVGVWWLLSNFSFDYAFVPFGDLGNAHRLSVTLRWGEGGARAERAYRPPAPKPEPKPEPKKEKKAAEAKPAPAPAAPAAPAAPSAPAKIQEPKKVPTRPPDTGLDISE
ncbi:MAG: hypothetical protein HY922_03555, partial [Elusimicrobia bacterium]|nr:hypothetical protein [Elusimicrobiota bacterium]